MKKIELPPRGLETLFGVHDQNIKYLESLLDVRIDSRGEDVSIDGDPTDVETVEHILEDFSELFKEGRHFTDKELREAFAQIAEDRAFSLRDYFTKARFNPAGKKQVAPKSANQRKYHSGDPGERCRLWHWSGWNWKNVPGCGNGGSGVDAEASQSYRAGASCC